MNIFEKLLAIQQELKAPKSQYNSFGRYSYRSCEDILEAVKPICAKYGVLLTISDELVYMGDRYYIKATAGLVDTVVTMDYVSKIENTAYAREEETKKGMDGSQITGTASSYARKYALNGLFCIDDTKDADTDEFKKQEQKVERKQEQKPEPEPKADITTVQLVVDRVARYAEMKNGNAEELLKYYLNRFKVKHQTELTQIQADSIVKELNGLIARRQKQ